MISVYAFRWVPPFAQGLVRDLRVRWALEEAGVAYREKLIDRKDQDSADYRAVQPFGQIPAYEEDGLTLFESGAIVLHIARKSEVLMPREPEAEARTLTWMFAALNSVEPPVQRLAMLDLHAAGERPAISARAAAIDAVEKKLDPLSIRLERRDYLEERFTAADLLMITVLRILRHTDLVTRRPSLQAYQMRCEARPAFRKALAAHLAAFATNQLSA